MAETSNNKNFTDPIVILDPMISTPTIAVQLKSESVGEKENEEGISNPNATVDSLKIDGKKYPLITINDRNINYNDILIYKLSFDEFLPTLYLKIKDNDHYETNLNTTGMSGYVKTCIVPEINNIYKNISIQFRILSVDINKNDNTVSYDCVYDTEKFRQTNTGLIYAKDKKANTYEMLNKIAELSGLGFAATKNTEDINDRIYRNIFTQRFDSYIKEQLKFAGTDEESILDAWIDPYNYIVLVNVSWVLEQEVKSDNLEIVCDTGTLVYNDGTGKQEPSSVPRMLTNFQPLDLKSNLSISDYNIEVNNDSTVKGTLEKIYSIDFVGKETKMNILDIQTQEDSIDGEHLEEYNTGSSRPIPKFNFNEDYNLDIQKVIRKHFFRKKRQNILNVTLENINLGLQRGTLVYLSIWENNPKNKQIMIMQESNLVGNDTTEPDKTYDTAIEAEQGLISNMKLSDVYYIDSIYFEYRNDMQSIKQILKLIKQGNNNGYENLHTSPRLS